MAAALGLLGLLVGWWASVIIFDDALITFRVADNLARNQGFVYNLGERVQVTTTPLYTILLAGGAWLFGSAYQAALPLNLTLSGLIPMLAYALGRRVAGRITGLGGALLLVTAPLLVIAFSMESYLYVTLILATLIAYVKQQPRWAGILAGLTALVRGDAALFGACLLAYDLVAQRRRRWSLILPTVLIPAGWYLFALLYFGNPFPATLNAKVAQGQYDWLGLHFVAGLGVYWQRWVNENDLYAFYLLPALLGLGLLRAIRTERLWLVLIGRDVAQISTFYLMSIPAAEWYYAPLMPGLALLTARGIQEIAEVSAGQLTRRFRVGSGGAVSASVALLLLLVLFTAIYPATSGVISQNPDWKAKVYPDAARWIAQNTSSSASLATIDIGHLGYWSNRPIIDIVGLAQPDVAAYIAQGDFGYALRHYQPDLILIGFTWLPEVQSTAWFQEAYVARHYFKFQTYDEPLVLFSRREGVKVQPETVPISSVQPLAVDFNHQINLTGYHLNTPLRPGGPLNLTLFWAAVAPVTVDFTVFVQLVDEQNRIVAQRDSKPQEGFYGTPYWQPGEKIADWHTFLLPVDLPPGRYDLLVGLYDVETGQRLQILDEAGLFKKDHIRLADVPVSGLP